MHGNNMPRRAVSTTVPATGASEQVAVKFNTIARVQVPHAFVNYSVTRPAVCQYCGKLMTPFRPAKHCKGVLVESSVVAGDVYLFIKVQQTSLTCCSEQG